MRKSLWVYAICWIFLGCQKPSFEDPWIYVKNKQVSELIKKEEYDEAKRLTFDLLKQDPLRFEHHLNLGLVLERTKEPEEALKSYSRAFKEAKNEIQKFVALYNQAQNLGQQKKVDQALSFYQQALALNPQSQEIKVNIELLIQQQQQQQQQGKGGGQGDSNKPEDSKDKDKDKDKDKEEEKPQNYKESPKYKPREFKGKDLSEYDVKQILGEIERQEQKMRADYHRKQTKERARDKDW